MISQKVEDWRKSEHFQFDMKRAKKNDEEIVSHNKIRRNTILLALITLVGTCAFIYLKIWILFIICGIICILCLMLWKLQGKSDNIEYLTRVYNTGLEVPAVIIKTDPLTVYAMANLSVHDVSEKFGVIMRELKALPGHKLQVGERIPCAAMFELAKDETQFAYFEIHPFCWATDNADFLAHEIQRISDWEWEILDKATHIKPPLESVDIVELDEEGDFILRRYASSESGEIIPTLDMEEEYKKIYPQIQYFEEETDDASMYNGLIRLAVQYQVYEYFCIPDHETYFLTFMNKPTAFSKKVLEEKLPLGVGEVPLIYGNFFVTNKGFWQKKNFIPWSDGEIYVNIVRGGRKLMRVELGRKQLVLDNWSSTYYPPETEQEIITALEKKRMSDFFYALKEGMLQ